MADIRLFKYGNEVKQLKWFEVDLEKELQNLIETNMFNFFGVHFLASEYVTTNGGRMDSIGIDENNCPVIFEYKRNKTESVINQGLFYLDWLVNHKDSFKLLVLEKFDEDVAQKIDWSMPRVICIASDFSKYDEFAINQMNKSISLIKYKKFDENIIMFEQVNQNIVSISTDEETKKIRNDHDSFEYQFEQADSNIKELYGELKEWVLSLGDEVSESQLKLYVAFRKIKNILTVVPKKNKLILNLPLNTETTEYISGFSRNVKDIGHWGCGDVEITIKNTDDLERAKPYIERSYEEN